MAFPFRIVVSSSAIRTKVMGSCKEPKNRMNAGYLKGKIWMTYAGS